MSYQPNIPTANQTIKETQGPINTNFTVANTAFGVDHVDFATVTNQGNHKKVSLITGADPAAVNQGPILYAKTAVKSELFMERSIGDGSTIIQMTTGNPVAAIPGSSFLPGGVIINWGTVSCGIGANPASNFATAFPNNLFSVALCCSNTVQTQTATAVTTKTAITIYSSAVQPVSYIAIGN